MKHILFTKKLLLLAMVLLGISTTGCIKEDLDECYTLKLKVENIKGDDITGVWMDGIHQPVYLRREPELFRDT